MFSSLTGPTWHQTLMFTASQIRHYMESGQSLEHPACVNAGPRVSMCVRGLPHVAAIHHPTTLPSITTQLLFITFIKQRLLWLQKPVDRGLLLHEPAVVPGERDCVYGSQ